MERQPPGIEPPPIPAAAPLGPVRESERILALDALRGFALFGILVVNVKSFALPLAEMDPGAALAQAPASHQLAQGLVRALFDQKFVSLFSLLFGIGLIVQRDRAKAAG